MLNHWERNKQTIHCKLNHKWYIQKNKSPHWSPYFHDCVLHMYTICMSATSETIRKVTKVYSYVPCTYHVLDHEGPFGPHLSHKVVDVEIIFLLQSLHHCINSNECASSAHTSTVKEQHPTSKNSTHTHLHKHKYMHTSAHKAISFSPTQPHTTHLQWTTRGAVLFKNTFRMCWMNLTIE